MKWSVSLVVVVVHCCWEGCSEIVSRGACLALSGLVWLGLCLCLAESFTVAACLQGCDEIAFQCDLLLCFRDYDLCLVDLMHVM